LVNKELNALKFRGFHENKDVNEVSDYSWQYYRLASLLPQIGMLHSYIKHIIGGVHFEKVLGR